MIGTINNVFDFGKKTDSELTDIIEGAFAEINKRAGIENDHVKELVAAAVKTAIAQVQHEIGTQEAKKAAEQIRAEAEAKQAQIAANLQKKSWDKKKDIALKCIEIFGGEDLYITVWNKNHEKRIYIQRGRPFSKKSDTVAEFYPTGNSKQAPNSLNVWGKNKTPERQAIIKELCVEIAAQWVNLSALNCDEAAQA